MVRGRLGVTEFHIYIIDVRFCPPQCGLYSFRAQDKAERLSPVDPGIIRGVTYLYPSRGYTPRNTRDRSITRSLQMLSFDQIPFWSISHTAEDEAYVFVLVD